MISETWETNPKHPDVTQISLVHHDQSVSCRQILASVYFHFTMSVHFFEITFSSFGFIVSTFNCVACVRLQLSSGQKTNTPDQVADQIHLSIPRFLHPYTSSVFVFSNYIVFNWDIWCLVWRGCRGGQGLQPNWYESYTQAHRQKCVIAQCLKTSENISNNPVSFKYTLTHLP